MDLSFLFSWLPGFSDRINGENDYEGFADFYSDFLMESGICSQIFFWGIGIAAIVCLVYYLYGCNRFHKVANRITWAIILVLTCFFTWLVSYRLVLGDIEGERGLLYEIADKTWTKAREGIVDEENLSEIDDTHYAYLEQFSNHLEQLPAEMALAVVLYAFITFFILSICVKGTTTHGKGVPF